MKRLGALALGLWMITAVTPAQAQLFNFFRKAPPPVPPAQRVAQLIGVIKTDKEERKRTAAVEELREFDTKAHPEVVPVLVEAAQHDPRAGVRSEAINSLVRIRPISTIAGQAIEHAATHDENWRNRMSAQAALVRYRLAGYSSPPAPPAAAKNAPGKGPAVPPQSSEPPLADAPQILYYDQSGKQIAPPKNLDGPIIPVPAPRAPLASQPRTTGRPVPPIVESGPTPTVPSAAPRFTAPPSATPALVSPLPSVSTPIPQRVAEPAPFIPVPSTSEPAASEPVFRPVNKSRAPAPLPTKAPTGPLLDVSGQPALQAPTSNQGPALIVPPLPAQGPVLDPTPAPAAGPVLNTYRPDLTPRLGPAAGPALTPVAPVAPPLAPLTPTVPSTTPAPF